MVTLSDAIRRLYELEMNCGVSTFYDGGVTAWVGDDANGRRAEQTFPIFKLDEVGPWLLAAARIANDS